MDLRFINIAPGFLMNFNCTNMNPESPTVSVSGKSITTSTSELKDLF